MGYSEWSDKRFMQQAAHLGPLSKLTNFTMSSSCMKNSMQLFLTDYDNMSFLVAL